MAKSFPFVPLLVSFISLTSSELHGDELKPKWYFELAHIRYNYAGFATQKGVMPQSPIISYGEGYLGKFLLLVGPIEVGTVVWERSAYEEIAYNWFFIGDTLCTWAIERCHFSSYFPLILTITHYTQRLSSVDLSLHGYLKVSWWCSGEHDVCYRGPPTHDRYFYRAYNSPSSRFDAGIGLSLSPLRYVLLSLRFGICRLDYAYHVLKPFKGQMPGPIVNRFYFSCGLSLGRWGRTSM